MVRGSFKYAKIQKMNTSPTLGSGTPMSESEAESRYNFTNSFSCGMRASDVRLSYSDIPKKRSSARTQERKEYIEPSVPVKRGLSDRLPEKMPEKLAETPRALTATGYAGL